jgi:hypothetical protein
VVLPGSEYQALLSRHFVESAFDQAGAKASRGQFFMVITQAAFEIIRELKDLSLSLKTVVKAIERLLLRR